MAYVSAAPRADLTLNTNWFATLVESVKLRIARERAYRRTYEELSMMTDRELADINLSRLSLRDVAREAAARAH